MTSAFLCALVLFAIFKGSTSVINLIAPRVTTTDAISNISYEKVNKIELKTTKISNQPLKKSFAPAKTSYISQKAATGANSASPATSYLNIGGANIPIFAVADTTVDAGNSAALYNGRFLYGHRGTAFGAISALPLGTTFTLTVNGVTSTYVIANSVTLDKSTTARFMYSFAIDASYKGQKYDLVLMTCAGTSVGDGDSTHRATIFAYKV